MNRQGYKWLKRILSAFGLVAVVVAVQFLPIKQWTQDLPQQLRPIAQIGQEAQRILTIGMVGVAYAATPDYVVDGTADDVQAQQALNALPATGGELLFYGGDYVFDATVSRAINNVTISGSGKATYFANDGGTALFSAGAQTGWIFRDFRTDGGWLTVASDTLVSRVWNATDLVLEPSKSAALVVAASDSSILDRARADYVCDGTADDIEIQLAIDYFGTGGGELHLTTGTYYISTALVIDGTHGNRMLVTGEHLGTILRPAADISIFDIDSAFHPRFYDFYIQGYGTETANAIVVDDTDGIVFDGLSIEAYGTGYGIHLHGAVDPLLYIYNPIINNCYFWDCKGFKVEYCDEGIFMHNNVHFGTMQFSNVFAASIIANVSSGSPDQTEGIYCVGVNWSHILSNTIGDSDQQGIVLNACSKTEVAYNKVYYSNTGGDTPGWSNAEIFVQNDSSDCSINNNTTISVAADYGIADHSASGASGNKMVDNKISGAVVAPVANYGGFSLIRDNTGYLAPGEVRTLTGEIATLTQNAYNSVDNPFGQSVRVVKLDIYVSTQATATSPNIDCGIGSSATTDYTTLFNDLPGETVGFYTSTIATPGTQTVPQLWASGAGNRYLNMSIKDAAATGMIAIYTVTIMGI